MSQDSSFQHGDALPPLTVAVVPPPPRVSRPKNTLWQDLQQGFEYVRFVWHISTRIRGMGNRVRFIVGLILWKPILPREETE